MTDRIRHLTVVLDADYRENDVEDVASAIRQLRGVAEVTLTPLTVADHLARSSLRADWRAYLHNAVEAVMSDDDEFRRVLDKWRL